MLRKEVLLIFLLILVTIQHGSTSSSKSRASKSKSSKGFIEGDMILNKFQKRNLAFGPRNGLISKQYRWPKDDCGDVIVPYKFKNSSEFSEF